MLKIRGRRKEPFQYAISCMVFISGKKKKNTYTSTRTHFHQDYTKKKNAYMVSLHCLTDWYSSDEDMQIYEPHKLSYIQKWKGIDYVFN